MANSDSFKKEIMISVRIEGQEAELIDAVADYFQISRSELIRNAASTYISLTVDNPKFPNPKLYFSHNMLKILFTDATEDTIKRVAYQSFENGKRDYRFFREITQHRPLEEILGYSPEEFVKSAVENVFAANGQNWFKKVSYHQKGDTISVAGTHDMGTNFSLFIKYLLEYYMHEINYSLLHERISRTEVIGKSGEILSIVRFDFKRNQ